MRRNNPIILILLFLNVGVFLGWTVASGGDREVFIIMAENFLVSWQHLELGYWWTLITSVFSHKSPMHLFFNMFVLLGFGPVVCQFLGVRRFLVFYLIAGLNSSLFHCATSLFVLGDSSLPALGASGAIAGLVMLFSLLFPQERILLLGVIPIKAIFGALLFVAVDLYGLFAQSKGGGLPIGHGAHLGGAFVGVFYYFWIRVIGKMSSSRR